MKKRVNLDPLFTDLYSQLLSEKKHSEARVLKFYILHKNNSLLYKKVKDFSAEITLEEVRKKKKEKRIANKITSKKVWHPNAADLVNDFLQESSIGSSYIEKNLYLKENQISYFDFLNLSDILIEEIIHLRNNKKIGSLAQGDHIYILNKNLFMDAFSKIRHDDTCSCIKDEETLKKEWTAKRFASSR